MSFDVRLTREKSGPTGCMVLSYYFSEPTDWIREQGFKGVSLEPAQDDNFVHADYTFENPDHALLFKLMWGGRS